MAKTITIGIIPPYEAMVPLIEDLKKGYPDIELYIEAGNLEAGVLAAKRMEQAGADLIISRGGTASLIRSDLDLPVIDIRITGYDLLRAITVMGVSGKADSALAGFPSVTMGAAAISGLLEMDIQVATIQEAAEISQVLEKLKKEGISRVLGDVVTVETAEALGMEGVLIQSGLESIAEAIEEAQRLIASLKKGRRKERILRTLLARQQMDYVVMAEDGRILEEQWTQFERAPISTQELERLRQQLLSASVLEMAASHNGELSISLQLELADDQDGPIFYAYFEKTAAKAAPFRLEQIKHLPPLAQESTAMKNLLSAVQSPAHGSSLLWLLGKDGLAKRELARFLHVFHGKIGFFAAVDSVDFPELDLNHLPEAATTVFIELSSIPDKKTASALMRIADQAAAKKVQLMISAAALTSDLAEKAVFEQAIVIAMPDLSEREADIPGMIQTYLEEFHQTLGTQPVKVQKGALESIVDAVKASNLASLKAYIKNLALIEKTYVITSSTLQKTVFMPIGDFAPGMIAMNSNETLKEMEQKIINHVLKEEKLNQTKAANRLGINRATLWRKLKA